MLGVLGAGNSQKCGKSKSNFFFGLVASKFKIHNFEKIIIMKFGALMGPRPLGGSGEARAPPVRQS